MSVENIQRYKTFLESIQMGVAIVDVSGRIIECNPGYAKLLNSSEDDLTGRNISEWTASYDRPFQRAFLESCINTGGGFYEVSYINPDKNIPIEINASVISDVHIIMFCQDISTRKRNEEQVKKSTEEKEILLREIHHRVKNNMAVVASILDLHTFYIEDEKAQEVLQACQKRIRSMALIHEKLYQSESLSKVNFKEYIEGLAVHITNSNIDDIRDISIRIEADDIDLVLEKAMPCGMILNEIMTNSYKHAFKDRSSGEIKVVFRYNETTGKYFMSVSDNGTGIKEVDKIKYSGTLGMTLVNALSKQLHAEMEITSGQGLEISISF